MILKNRRNLSTCLACPTKELFWQ